MPARARPPAGRQRRQFPGPQIKSKCKDATPAPSRAKTKQIVAALLCIMNEQRKLAKLKPLKSSTKLTKAALAHTRAMIGGAFFAHQGPSEPALERA